MTPQVRIKQGLVNPETDRNEYRLPSDLGDSMFLPKTPVKVRVIINADDMGISSDVNDAILDHVDRGLITSSTILANGPAFDDAVRRVLSFPQASWGVHLNATEFAPVTNNPDLEPLLDRDHRFAGNLRYVKFTSRLRRALANEWIAQIDKVRQAGVNVSHIDSHHHVHTCPGFFGVLKTVQRHCQIRKVRITKNIYSSKMPAATSWRPMQKAAWNCMLRHALYRTVATQGMTEFATFIESPISRYSTLELVTHPGNCKFEKETEMLSKPWLANLPFEAALVNYHEI